MSLPTARLYCLLAREARVGVVFRRGPTGQVLLIRWDLAADTFQTGQWFKGRIYERRCDLSPKGDKLIYFAATYKKPLYSWTALSKPPWLTAIALWPKGDGWNGGGYFENERDLFLNHFATESELQPNSRLSRVRVTGYATHRGEDDTVHQHLLKRGGWHFIQDAVWKRHQNKRPNKIAQVIQMIEESNNPFAAMLQEHGISIEQLEKAKQTIDKMNEDSTWSPKGWIAEQPEVWQKVQPDNALILRQELHGIARRNQNWYDLRYVINDSSGTLVLDLGALDWAEWDTNGDLLYARDGCLYRAKVENQIVTPAMQLADFNALKFEAIASPEEARSWRHP